jgi:hypothetical protein
VPIGFDCENPAESTTSYKFFTAKDRSEEKSYFRQFCRGPKKKVLLFQSVRRNGGATNLERIDDFVEKFQMMIFQKGSA